MYYNKKDKEYLEIIEVSMKKNIESLKKAVKLIYAKQTLEEKGKGIAKEDNGVGFNSFDAEILSSLAVRINLGYTLTDKQIAVLKKRMPKYAGQLLRIAKENGKYATYFENKKPVYVQGELKFN